MRLLSPNESRSLIDGDIAKKKAELSRLITEIKKALAIFEEAKAKSIKQLDRMEHEKLQLQEEITNLNKNIDSLKLYG